MLQKKKKSHFYCQKYERGWFWVGDSVCDTDIEIEIRVREDESKTITDHTFCEMGKIDYY